MHPLPCREEGGKELEGLTQGHVVEGCQSWDLRTRCLGRVLAPHLQACQLLMEGEVSPQRAGSVREGSPGGLPREDLLASQNTGPADRVMKPTGGLKCRSGLRLYHGAVQKTRTALTYKKDANTRCSQA